VANDTLDSIFARTSSSGMDVVSSLGTVFARFIECHAGIGCRFQLFSSHVSIRLYSRTAFEVLNDVF